MMGRRRCITASLSFLKVKVRSALKLKENQLVRTQIQVISECFEQCTNPERKAKYNKGLSDLEDKLDLLLMP